MAELTVLARTADVVGVPPEAGGDSFKNDGATELHVFNPTESDVEITVAAVHKCTHGFLDDQVETIEAGGLERLGPFDPGRFNDPTGLTHFSFDSVAGIEVAPQRQK